MSYLLHVAVSPFGDNSKSRTVSAEFESAYQSSHPAETVVTRDLHKNPVPHIDGEALTAGYMPEDARPESMQKKHQLRLDLIKEISEANHILFSVPMWNWSIPSVLKAYIDHLVMPGVLDPQGNKKLAGKTVTIVLATGGSYVDGAPHKDWNHASTYLEFIVKSLGATDVKTIQIEYCLAGVVPQLEAFIPNKEASIAAGKESAAARAKQI